jgi:molecular chaperone DnaK (HSP70)
MSIRYLKDQFLGMARDQVTSITESDVQLVLTVPAIWNDAAKQFLREAAVEVIINIYVVL